MQAAGNLIASAAEFSAGMQNGKHDRNSRQTGFMLYPYRDTASIIGNIHNVSRQQLYDNSVTESSQGLVNGIIHNLIHQMVQPSRPCGADIHARAFPYRFQAFQHLNLVAVIFFLYFSDFIGIQLTMPSIVSLFPQASLPCFRDSAVLLTRLYYILV